MTTGSPKDSKKTGKKSSHGSQDSTAIRGSLSTVSTEFDRRPQSENPDGTRITRGSSINGRPLLASPGSAERRESANTTDSGDSKRGRDSTKTTRSSGSGDAVTAQFLPYYQGDDDSPQPTKSRSTSKKREEQSPSQKGRTSSTSSSSKTDSHHEKKKDIMGLIHDAGTSAQRTRPGLEDADFQKEMETMTLRGESSQENRRNLRKAYNKK